MDTSVVELLIGDLPYTFNAKTNCVELRKQICDKGMFFFELKPAGVLVGLQVFVQQENFQSEVSIIDLFDIRYADIQSGTFDIDAIIAKAQVEAERNKMV